MRLISLSVLLFILLVRSAWGYRILGIFPLSSKSHYILGGAIMRALAKAGHDITVVTVFHDDKISKNSTWREIFLDGLFEKQNEMFKNHVSPKKKQQSDFLRAINMYLLFDILGIEVTKETLAHSKMQQLIKSGEKFDAVIIPQFMIEAMKALATHFDAHLILFNTQAANSWMNHLVGNPTSPSFFPEYALSYPEKMSFMQRVSNTICKYILMLILNYSIYPKHSELVHRYISKDVDFYDALYNVSLILTNGHESLNHPRPSVPCIKDIGGFHIEPTKELPHDLQKYLDDAKDGAILFSMGTNVRIIDLPVNVRKSMIEAFAKRKERIIMKWEGDILPENPHNVRISKWLPQSEILAHPNLKLFVSHGGLLSNIEAIHHGVPIIALPVFGDHQENARQAVNDGFAIGLELRTLTEENFAATIEEILTNKRYMENVKKRSRILHDRILSPLDEAVFWVEYVIRHDGAQHLRVSHVQMPWYQYILLDIFLSFSAIICIFLIVLNFICKKTIGRIFKTKKLKNQ